MRSLLALSLVAAGCAPVLSPLPFAPAGPDAAPDPAAPGPYPVGVQTLTFVDDSRTTEGKQGPRTLVCEVWYPAVEEARGGAGERYVLYDNLPEEVRGDLAPQDLGTLETAAVRDAAPRLDRGPYPLVLFSHGQGGVRVQSTFYTVPLASHGYVVLAPDHEGDTVGDLLLAGDLEVGTAARNYVERPIDMVFLMNAVDALPADDPLRQIVDMQRIATTGHSFGAFTAMAVAGQNVGVAATVAQAPVGKGAVETATDVPLEEFGIPVMIQSAGQDQILPADTNAQSLWDHMVAPRAWLHIDRAGHFTYSDLCIFDVVAIDAALEVDASNVLEDGCGPQNTPLDVAYPIINRTAIGFFNLHLQRSPLSARWLTQEQVDAVAAGEATLAL